MANDLTNYIQNNGTYKAKNELLLNNYKSQVAGIERNKRAQQDAAAISYQKLMKYLPEYNASMGLRGSGAASGAALEANARYRSQQGQIAADYDAQKASAEQAHNQNMLNLYTEAQAAQKAEQADAYTLAKDTINNWSGSSDKLKEYYEGLKGTFTDDQEQSLTQAYNSMYEGVLEQEKNEAFKPDKGWEKLTVDSAPSKYKKGHNFEVSVGDRSYKVQVGEEVTNKDAITAAMNAGYGEGDIIKYGGKLYLVSGSITDSGDGLKLFEIEKRTLDTDNYNDALLLAETTGGKTTSKLNAYNVMGWPAELAAIVYNRIRK